MQTRLEVSAVQIIERLKIRSENLRQLLEEDLDVGNQLMDIRVRGPVVRSNFMGLETLLTQKGFDIQSERRRTDVECWRDLVQVMRDFLNAWESLTQLKAKQRFLSTISSPDYQNTYTLPQTALSYHDEIRNQNDYRK